MQLDCLVHFHEIVIPAWQAYLEAEVDLTKAISGKQPAEAIQKARYKALREGGASAIWLHQFSDVVARDKPDWLPTGCTSLTNIRTHVSKHCKMLRSSTAVDDVKLLADVADSLKHCELTRKPENREVSAKEAVLVIGTGYGELCNGESKYGGVDQVLIKARSGTRALSSVLHNVIDAWRAVARLELPEKNKP